MRMATPLFRALVVAGLAVVVLAGSVSTASAFDPRVPPVVFSSANLQGYLNGVGESINVTTDQLNGQVWSTSISGNSEFTLMMEFAANSGVNTLGLYNTNGPVNPPLYLCFPGFAGPGWFATAHFASGQLRVTLFDNNSIVQGQNVYFAVDPNAFGFYIQGPGGTWYSQDSRNTNKPQILTFAGTGRNFGEWWQCFEDAGYVAATSDFDDAILLCQSVTPTGITGPTWGHLKALYRK